eukprot:CAMPEP_0172719392 /NCGR_PEP_ID=MMETSP1074-20121228/75477_1 /TAXON_ID=2916 /ORGANISM="Ceratium fusus, Strain PA161109" /LENGTH=106 /DNA_ID=CAMNT_0013544739 /DNA_START=73 /DNA_END=394 /DNA_ORIENTATION=+
MATVAGGYPDPADWSPSMGSSYQDMEGTVHATDLGKRLWTEEFSYPGVPCRFLLTIFPSNEEFIEPPIKRMRQISELCDALHPSGDKTTLALPPTCGKRRFTAAFQ